jgi:2-C-methyl-D-erythritol 4-phosphate cytidylyltransferase
VRVDAVIVAAGASTRFGAEDKLFAELCGRPVLAWSLAAYEPAESVQRLVVVAAPGNRKRVEALARDWAPAKFAAVVDGGARRRDSVEAGLQACRSRYVAIHDGARPLVTAEVIERVVARAEGKPGAIAAVPVTDTIKEVRGGAIVGSPDRSRLWAAQTPQVVLRQAWLDAAAAGDDDETDDAAMLARLGLDCVVVEGSPENLKITRPFDLEIARLILTQRAAP